VEEELKVEDGKIPLPQRPGLGFELRPAALAEFAAAAEQKYSIGKECCHLKSF